MSEQLSFEGMEVVQEYIKLRQSWVQGLGTLGIGTYVQIEGVAKCVGVSFEKDKHSGAGVRIHILVAEDVKAVETLTDAQIRELGL